jgi:hypothetical protein
VKKFLFLAIILCITISACMPGTEPTLASSPIPPVSNSPTLVSFAPSVSIVGEPEVVYRWGSDRCADDMLPDLPTRAIRNTDGTVLGRYTLYGYDLRRITQRVGGVRSTVPDRTLGNAP